MELISKESKFTLIATFVPG